MKQMTYKEDFKFQCQTGKEKFFQCQIENFLLCLQRARNKEWRMNIFGDLVILPCHRCLIFLCCSGNIQFYHYLILEKIVIAPFKLSGTNWLYKTVVKKIPKNSESLKYSDFFFTKISISVTTRKNILELLFMFSGICRSFQRESWKESTQRKQHVQQLCAKQACGRAEMVLKSHMGNKFPNALALQRTNRCTINAKTHS